ncbi:MAG: PCMD domain-containing protein [Muribaculaceae bacterium]|nr:PCMD domain-containing protein [Muribaculaceae bacterium]
MKRSVIYIIALLTLIGAGGCIHNDLPYPKLPQNILSIAAKGELSPAKIDSTDYTVRIFLDEQVDIQAVQFTQFTYSHGAECNKNLLEGSWDLSVPMTVELSLYQSYQWMISAEQNIERYFTVAGQIGETVIDAVGRRIIVSVPERADLSKVEVTSIKLGPRDITTIVPAVPQGSFIDLNSPLRIDVNAWGRTEDWTIYAQRTEQVVTTTSVDPWSMVVWAYGQAPAEAVNYFEYQEQGSSSWIRVPDEDTTGKDGAFSCCIKHLKPLTTYTVRACSGDNKGNEMTVTTQATEILPDGDFENWWKNGRIWCPWTEGADEWPGGSRFWDTGNTGAATLGESNVKPSDYVPAGMTGQSAELKTEFKGIGMLGKLAAGSIYTGNYKKTDGTNGILDFGRPWSVRPTKLRGYYQYTNGDINYSSKEMEYLKGRPDTCSIYIAMTDWTAPYEIRTNPNNRQLFDKNASYVIAYGELQRGTSMDAYEEFEIELKYRSTSIMPTYIMITCASSKYGDYFTGSSSSVLYVDQLSLDYDY